MSLPLSLIRDLACEWNAGDWRLHASCRETDLDLFFPSGLTGPAVEQIEAAKAVCCRCPVRAECLEFALITNQDCGVWGGTTEDERRSLRRKWRAQGHSPKLVRATVSPVGQRATTDSWRAEAEGQAAG